jgi:hypothetical protein
MRVSESSAVSCSMMPDRSSHRRFAGPSLFNDSVTSRVIKLSFWLLGTCFLATSIVWFIEKREPTTSFSLPSDLERSGLTWIDSFYFVGVGVFCVSL